ncbi:MAG: autotransporter-associated beta strand repeat-containing protein, partial [Puniceicoccales bacterium]|nr:autotransporter-associated beta strand repeat-containing protein [Puniceicoccales bacterium]
MRFSKASLVAAALVIAAPCALVATTINNTYYTSTGGSSISNLDGAGIIIVDTDTLTLDVNQASTFRGVILDDSVFTGTQPYDYTRSQSRNLVKTGTGTLQYDGFRHLTANLGLTQFDITDSYYRNNTGQAVIGNFGTFELRVIRAQMESIYASTYGPIGALSGTVTVEAGTLMVSGYMNQWVQYPNTAIPWADDYKAYGIMVDASGNTYGEMKGASATILNGNAALSFQNTDQNVVNAKPLLGDSYNNGPFTPLSKRLNFVHNLQTGTLDTGTGKYSNDQFQTQLDIGQNADGKSEYRIFVHMDKDVEGSVGIIQGNSGGRFFKSGAGDFKILNNSTFTGDVFLAGGTTTLASQSASNQDQTLGSVNSINLVGTNGYQGAYIAEAVRQYSINNVVWEEFKGAYAPAQELTELATLEIISDQRINNLQALFTESAAATDADLTVDSAARNAANSLSADEPFVANTGKGTNIKINSHQLTINQSLDGYYEGSINKGLSTAQGTVIKKGAGTLALLLDSAGMFKDLVIEEGNVIANAQGLGWGTVSTSSGGTLTIVQNTSGTLHARIKGGAEDTLFITTYDYITNLGGNQIRVGTNAAGQLEVAQTQEDFRGTVVASDGVVVLVGSTRDENNQPVPNSDVFKNVAAFILTSGDSGLGSTLDLNDTNQTIRNLSGDAKSRIRLGKKTLTLIQDESSIFTGIISGSGSLMKDGAGSFTIAGENIYYGATAVKAGQLVLSEASTIQKSSGLIIASGTSVQSPDLDQQIGALFGGTGALLNIGSGNLTIGVSKKLRAELLTEKSKGNFVPEDFLATTTSNISTPGETESYLASLGIFQAGTVDEGIIDPANEKYYLSYAGKISGSGTLTKIGTETLKLSGVSDGFSGKVEIQEGMLWINHDSLSSTPSIDINPDASSTTGLAQLAVFVDAGVSANFSTATTGSGDFYKVGAGELNLSNYSYTGQTFVQNGRLVLKNSSAGFSFSSIAIDLAGTLIVDQAAETTATFAGPITGSGNFEKDGEGKLTLSGNIGHTGSTSVIAGELEVWSLPQGTINIEEAGTLTALIDVQTTGDIALNGDLTGNGTFNKTGNRTLSINSAVAFAGTVNIKEGTVSLGTTNVLSNAIVHLEDTTSLLFNNNDQVFAAISGASGSLIDMGSGSLTLNVSTSDKTYAGEIKGSGDVIMNAVPPAGMGSQDCKLTLTGDNQDFTGNLIVNSGVFQAKVSAIQNSSSITVGTGSEYAELRFYATIGETVSFDAAIGGTGIIGKSGKGTVSLGGTGINDLSSGAIRVEEGRLIINDNRVGLGLPDVAVSKGATFQINMSQDYTYAGEIGGTLGSQTVFQESGNFAVKGPYTLTLGQVPLYGGLTELLGGATLKFADDVNTINGLAGEAGTTVDAGNLETLTIAQNATGSFSGTIGGGVDLIITGTELFAYTGPDGSGNFDGAPNAIASIVVGDTNVANQGKLQVGIANEKDIRLVNGGTLFVKVDAADTGRSYDAIINGDGNLYKTGDGTWTLNKDSEVFKNGNIETLGVVDGILELELDGGLPPVQDFAVGTSLITNPDGTESRRIGTLQLNIENGTLDFNKVIEDAKERIFSITGGGIVEKTGAGTLTFADQTEFTGTLLVSEGTLNGNFKTGGNLVNNAYLAPGKSIGTIIVNGDFIQGSTGTLEIEIDGTSYDKVLYTGSAELGGTVHITTIGAEPVRGTTYSFLTKPDGSADPTQIVTATVTTDDSAAINARYLLVGPNVALGTVYEQYGVNGAAILVAQKDLARVPGYSLHDGLGSFIQTLNDAADFAAPTYNPSANDLDYYNLGAILNTTGTSQLGAVINNFSPLAFSSMVAMPAAAANAGVEQLHARLEQRRYDRASYTDKSWQAYVTATSNFANNDDGTDDAVYNFNTYGGVVGTDCQVSDTNLFGAALEYTNGKASIHDGGGNIKMNAIRGTGYL